jgi:hypothetical protein
MFEGLNKRKLAYEVPEIDNSKIKSCDMLLFQELGYDLLKVVKLWQDKYNMNYYDLNMALEVVVDYLHAEKYQKELPERVVICSELLKVTKKAVY